MTSHPIRVPHITTGPLPKALSTRLTGLSKCTQLRSALGLNVLVIFRHFQVIWMRCMDYEVAQSGVWGWVPASFSIECLCRSNAKKQLNMFYGVSVIILVAVPEDIGLSDSGWSSQVEVRYLRFLCALKGLIFLNFEDRFVNIHVNEHFFAELMHNRCSKSRY